MKNCGSNRLVDDLREQEFQRIKDMSVSNDIAFASGLYFCATERICAPQWLLEGAAKLLIELLSREKSKKRGRSGGRIARYCQDLRDYERWCAVLEVREMRLKNKDELKVPEEQNKADERIKKTRNWLRYGTFECAAMVLKNTDAYATPAAVKASYRRVEKTMRDRPAAHRYHLTFNDFVFQIGLDWPGATKPGTKIVPFYDLTP
jgi:hypothetical protein